jgi:hypothetical protein
LRKYSYINYKDGNKRKNKNMNIERIDIKKIILNPNNPRTIKDDKFKKLVQSIKDFPQMLEVRPIVIDSDNVILGGNMRFKACKEAGLKEIPVIRFYSTDEKKKKEFLIKDNVNYGEWDYLMLENTEDLDGWGFDTPDWLNTDSLDSNLDDFFDEEFIEDYQKKILNEMTGDIENKSEYDGAYILFMLSEDDFNFVKKYENNILKKTKTDNLSDAFVRLLKNNLKG